MSTKDKTRVSDADIKMAQDFARRAMGTPLPEPGRKDTPRAKGEGRAPGGRPEFRQGDVKKEQTEEPRPLDKAKEVYSKLRYADSTAVHKSLSAQLTPWAIGAATMAVATVGSWTPAPVGIGIGSVAVAALTAGLYHDKALQTGFLAKIAQWARDEKVHTGVCISAAWVWFTAAVILGYGSAGVLSLVGIAFWTALSARWWQHHRPGYPQKALPQATAPTPKRTDVDQVVEKFSDLIDANPYVRLWKDKVACNGGALVGSELCNPVKTKSGLRFDLKLVRGVQTLSDARMALPRIVTALDVRIENLLIEEVLPTDDNPEPPPSILKFQVITDSPIRKTVPLMGPNWRRDEEKIWIDLGPYADGDGTAKWKVTTKNSVWGGYLVGDIGSGKSTMADNIALSIMDTGLFDVFYIDPQNGSSSPFLYDAATWSLGKSVESWEKMLAALEHLVDIRGMENYARLRVPGFTPSTSRPGVIVFIDECHEVFKYFTKRWADVARKGRKVGVGIIAMSQIYGLDAFGNDDALRQSIAGANTVALRVGRNQASLIHGMPLNPADLPKIPGYAVLHSEEGRIARSAPFRGMYAPEGQIKVMMEVAGRRQPELDELAAAALDALTDDAYSRRYELAEESLEHMLQVLEDLEAGLKPKLAEGVQHQPEPDAMSMVDELLAETEAYLNSPSNGLIGAKKLLVDSINRGVTTRAELLDIYLVEFKSEPWFDRALGELVRDKYIRRGVKSGIYLPMEKEGSSR